MAIGPREPIGQTGYFTQKYLHSEGLAPPNEVKFSDVRYIEMKVWIMPGSSLFGHHFYGREFCLLNEQHLELDIWGTLNPRENPNDWDKSQEDLLSALLTLCPNVK